MEGRQYHNHDRVVTADVLALRLALAAAGFIPIPLFGKAPPTFGKNNSRKGLSGWQKLDTVTDEMLALWERTWPDAVNTGILTRTTPALDLDILNEEAARAAEDLVRRRFEERGTILVRIGLPPKRAILFCTDTPFAKILVNLVAANGSAEKPEKLEFLGDGQQLAAFGIHPDTGQPYRWHGGEPGQVQREDLPLITDDEARALVAELVELLVRDFGYSRPTKRKRRSGAQTDGGSTTDWADLVSNIRDGQALHDSLCKLAAKLAKAGTHPGAIANHLYALLETSNAPRDDRFRERWREIPRLVDSAIGKYATPKQAGHAGAAIIRMIKGEIARVVDEAESALLAVADTAPILVRAGMLVQPIVDRLPASHERTTEVVLLRALTAANIVYLLNKYAATFEQYDGRQKAWVVINPPTTVAVQLLQKGQWRFPKVAGVITTPTLRPDGTILDRPGYDPATQLWYKPDSQLIMPPLGANPTREQAEQALALFVDLLAGFPFEGDVDRAVALATILTAVLRGAFDVVPMTLLRAPDVGTGKSFLADLISIIARGRVCPVITNAKSIEEAEKRLGALVLEGVLMVSLDNCSDNIGGDLLCQITERRLIRIRILGKSEAPECEWRGVLLATGNNITLYGDMTRRGLIANLDAKVERPELRKFSFDPIERALSNRGAYVAAAITIARAYIASSKPKVCNPLGSYGEWSDAVRSPLVWLGCEDPVQSMDRAHEEDPVRRAINTLITLWRKCLKLDVGYTAAELIKKASEQIQRQSADQVYEFDYTYPQLRELLVQQAGTPRGEVEPRRLGNWLMSIRGRIHDDHCIELVKENDAHGNKYALVARRGQ
jgi:putative DNA primase/helicase